MLKLGTSPRVPGRMCCRRLFGLRALAGLAVVTGLAVPRALAQTVDPQSLVGEWTGTWVGTSERLVQGTLNMTVTKVEGNQVHGQFERDGWGRIPAVRFNFVGTLEGDKLARFRELNAVDGFWYSDAGNGIHKHPIRYFDDKEQVMSGTRRG